MSETVFLYKYYYTLRKYKNAYGVYKKYTFSTCMLSLERQTMWYIISNFLFCNVKTNNYKYTYFSSTELKIAIKVFQNDIVN